MDNEQKRIGGRFREGQGEEEIRLQMPGGTGRGCITADRRMTTGIVLSPGKAASGNCRKPAGIFKEDPAAYTDLLQAAWLWCFGTACG